VYLCLRRVRIAQLNFKLFLRVESLCTTFNHLTSKARALHLDAEASKTRKLICDYPRFITEYPSHVLILHHMGHECVRRICYTNVASQCYTGCRLLAVELSQIWEPASFRTGPMTSFLGTGYELGSIPGDWFLQDFEFQPRLILRKASWDYF